MYYHAGSKAEEASPWWKHILKALADAIEDDVSGRAVL
jgi:hypothetical protein